ncbi:MAG: hypothetical protein RML72_10095 [Bacteroidia bacterium]|nr:hypothetical protein [Bacteroidia bacterium]MDW8159208.1 hypothetical protein [Bacteroidia bacterium]
MSEIELIEMPTENEGSNESRLLGIGSRVRHPEFGDGVVINASLNTYTITFMRHGIKEISTSFKGLEVIENVELYSDLVSLSLVEKKLINILRRWSDISENVRIHPKWQGGTLILQPRDKNLASKEVPIDQFFHKIVMIRDRLRVLEQKINSNDQISDAEKLNLQQYITRSYGSLTTFNLLFRDKEDYFVGEKGER